MHHFCDISIPHLFIYAWLNFSAEYYLFVRHLRGAFFKYITLLGLIAKISWKREAAKMTKSLNELSQN